MKITYAGNFNSYLALCDCLTNDEIRIDRDIKRIVLLITSMINNDVFQNYKRNPANCVQLRKVTVTNRNHTQCVLRTPWKFYTGT